MPNRNDPCPCGSGKKYKKCCQEKAQDGPRPHPAHDVDRKLVEKLLDFARRTRGEDWLPEAHEAYVGDLDLADPETETYWSIPYLLYHDEGPGGDEPTVLDDFLEARSRYLSQDELAILLAHQSVRVSLWEITAVRPGGIQLRDLLTDAERFVHELSLAADGEWVHLVLLARVLDLGDASILIGVHPVPLQPLAAERVRQEFLVRHPGPNPSKLRRGPRLLELTHLWRAAAEAQQRPPDLRNTDGEPMVLVHDRLTFPAGLRSEILALLENLADGEVVRDTGRFYRAGYLATDQGRTVLATFRLGSDFLTLETNSEQRADTFRQRLLDLHPGLKKGERTRKTIHDIVDRPSSTPKEYPPEVEQALQEKLLELRREHMRKWLDSPIPALDQTPRRAAKDPAMRKCLEALLKQLEYTESRRPAGQRIELEPIWAQLGLSER